MKKRIVYTGYIIIVTVFFLYLLFPGEAVTSFINYQVNNLSAGVNLNIREVKPIFPPGLKLSSPDMVYLNQPVIGAEFLEIKPSYLSLLKKDKTFFIKGDIYEGSLDSSLQIADISKNPEFDVNASFDGVQISLIPAIKTLEAYQVTGIANGNIVYGNKEIKAGKGNAVITISDGSIRFTPVLFGIDQVSFKSVLADLEIVDQRVTLKKLNVESRDVSGNATGSIILRNPVHNSTINIRGEINLHPTFIKQLGNIIPVDMIARQRSKTGGIPFRITGSLDRPNFSMR